MYFSQRRHFHRPHRKIQFPEEEISLSISPFLIHSECCPRFLSIVNIGATQIKVVFKTGLLAAITLDPLTCCLSPMHCSLVSDSVGQRNLEEIMMPSCSAFALNTPC